LLLSWVGDKCWVRDLMVLLLYCRRRYNAGNRWNVVTRFGARICHQMSYIETESSPSLLRWIVQHMATKVLDDVGSDLAKGQIWLSEKGIKSPNDWWTYHLETRQHKDSEMVLWKEWKIWSVNLTRSKSDLQQKLVLEEENIWFNSMWAMEQSRM
jgi:hypothetical protein